MRPSRSTLTPRARGLRKESTDAERKLWSRLRARQLNGTKFRRQVPVGPYIADFLCAESKLIVELDGGQHSDQVEYDSRRSEFLASEGYRVLRFWNNDVLQRMDSVLETILGAVSPSP